MGPTLSGIVLRSQTDERLVALARDGHDQAFVVIAQRYRRELLSHARQMVAADQAEDVVQQALLSALSALRRQSEVREVRAWLHRIVHNAALRAMAQLADHVELTDATLTAPGAASDVEGRLDARAAIAALAGLPETQRRALELTALQGHSGRDAAGELGISEGALRQLVHRARASLRAAATAFTPVPLLNWAARGTSSPASAGIAGMGGGAGIASVAAKAVATVAVTATAVGGATHVLAGRHGPSPRVPVAHARKLAPARASATVNTLAPALDVASAHRMSLPVVVPAGTTSAARHDRGAQHQDREGVGSPAAGHEAQAPHARQGLDQTGSSAAAGRQGEQRDAVGSQSSGDAGSSQPSSQGESQGASGDNQPASAVSTQPAGQTGTAGNDGATPDAQAAGVSSPTQGSSGTGDS